jgi:hypothetical protein
MLVCGDSRNWIYFETKFTSTHFRPLQDISSLQKKFNMLVMKKIPPGNPTCPAFVQCAKKIVNALVDRCNISSHECVCNFADNNAMLDPVEENNSNQGNMEVQEDEVEVDLESPNMIYVFHVVTSLPAHDSDTLHT